MPKAQNEVSRKQYRNCRWTPFETSRGPKARCLGHGMKTSVSRSTWRLDHRRQTVRTHPNRIHPLKSRNCGVSNTIARYFQSCEATSKSQTTEPPSISLTSDEISELNNLLINLSLSEVSQDLSAAHDTVIGNSSPPQHQEEQGTTTTSDAADISRQAPISLPETGMPVQPGADIKWNNIFEKTKSNDLFLTSLFNEYKKIFHSNYGGDERDDSNNISHLTVQRAYPSRDSLSPAGQIVVLILLLMQCSSEIPKLIVPKHDFTTSCHTNQPSPLLRPMGKVSSIGTLETDLGLEE